MRTIFTLLLVSALVLLALSACGNTRQAALRARPSRPMPTADAGSNSAVIQRDMGVLRSRSYTPDYHRVSHLDDGSAMYIFHSMCSGSADGHCQAVDAFLGESAKPAWHSEFDGVLSLRATRNGFAVRAVNYAPGDALCCPSLQPVTDFYIWDGSTFRERGALPSKPGN